MYKKILVPVDLAEESSWQIALPVAVRFAQLLDGSILVTTVVRHAQAYWEAAYLPFAFEELITRTEQKLSTIVSSEVPSDVSVSTKVGHGSICREILHIARDEKVNLILMAAHRPGIRDYLIGPNAAHVVHYADCSVLTVRGE